MQKAQVSLIINKLKDDSTQTYNYNIYRLPRFMGNFFR